MSTESVSAPVALVTGANKEVTAEESVRRAADFVAQAEEHLDVLANNAGIASPVRDPHDYTADDMAEVLLTNVAGYLRLIHAFLRLLEKGDNPRIVNVSSGLGSFSEFYDSGVPGSSPARRCTPRRRPRSTC
jgi:NAD(P)-dependent dehydrogenase (short-subunit alcohol dehydrogenase family)